MTFQDCFRNNIKLEYQNITSLSGNIPDKLSTFITTKWKEAHDQSGNADDRYKRSKHQYYNHIM